MGRTQTAKATAVELRRRIKTSEIRKKRLTNYLQELKDLYSKLKNTTRYQLNKINNHEKQTRIISPSRGF